MLLDPIARSAPGTEGVVDLYVMPAFDDVASLYFYNGEWQLCYSSAAHPVDAAVHDARPIFACKQTFQKVVEEMKGAWRLTSSTGFDGSKRLNANMRRLGLPPTGCWPLQS